MKQITWITLLLIISTCWLTAHAQKPAKLVERETGRVIAEGTTLPDGNVSLIPRADKDYVLTPDQAKQWSQLAEFERQKLEQHQAAIQSAVNTPVGDQSKEMHAAVQSTWLAASLARSQRAEWLARLQAEQGCPSCQIVDGKLTKRTVAASQ